MITKQLSESEGNMDTLLLSNPQPQLRFSRYSTIVVFTGTISQSSLDFNDLDIFEQFLASYFVDCSLDLGGSPVNQ